MKRGRGIEVILIGHFLVSRVSEGGDGLWFLTTSLHVSSVNRQENSQQKHVHNNGYNKHYVIQFMK